MPNIKTDKHISSQKAGLAFTLSAHTIVIGELIDKLDKDGNLIGKSTVKIEHVDKDGNVTNIDSAVNMYSADATTGVVAYKGKTIVAPELAKRLVSASQEAWKQVDGAKDSSLIESDHFNAMAMAKLQSSLLDVENAVNAPAVVQTKPAAHVQPVKRAVNQR